MSAGLTVHTGASLAATPAGAGSYAIEFQWRKYSWMNAFSSSIYSETSSIRAQLKKPFWFRCVEDLR
jgi:hypothetical protein